MLTAGGDSIGKDWCWCWESLRPLLFLLASVAAEGRDSLTAHRLSAILALVSLTPIYSLRYAQVLRIFLPVVVLVTVLSGCMAQPARPAKELAAVASVSLATPSIVPSTPVSQTRQPSTTPAPTPSRLALSATVTTSATLVATATGTSTPSPTTTATLTVTPTPGPTSDGVARRLTVPILMYHYVSLPPADADVYRRDLSVAPAHFAEQMGFLKDAGYTTVTLDDLLYALTLGRPLPPKPVILTFDDGYVDNYTNAFPVLRQNGFVATFFVMTDLVTDLAEGYMTWPQIEEMAAAGQRFGSHGRQDHRTLRSRSIDYLVWQALGSKEAIEEHLGYHPRWVAYPSGEYDSQTIAVFRSAGYWGGLTTSQGAEHSIDDIFELTRIRIRGSHTAADLARLLDLTW